MPADAVMPWSMWKNLSRFRMRRTNPATQRVEAITDKLSKTVGWWAGNFICIGRLVCREQTEVTSALRGWMITPLSPSVSALRLALQELLDRSRAQRSQGVTWPTRAQPIPPHTAGRRLSTASLSARIGALPSGSSGRWWPRHNRGSISLPERQSCSWFLSQHSASHGNRRPDDSGDWLIRLLCNVWMDRVSTMSALRTSMESKPGGMLPDSGGLCLNWSGELRGHG